MNILLISYGDYNYDGRLRELIKVFSNFGELHIISRGSIPLNKNHVLINSNYISFIKKAISKGKQINSLDVIVCDNRKSIIPGLKIWKAFHNAKLVLDCRELYLSKYCKSIISKIGCFFEKKAIKKADVIIAANKERAIFMKEYYNLKDFPLVFENYRSLNYSEGLDFEKLKKRFSENIKDGEFRIISTSGCDISRTNDVLVRNLKRIKKPCRLFLVGSSSIKDIKCINKICKKNGISNVDIIDQLNQDELKYLIRQCHLGIVNYHQKDLNNKYCASGKIFEFLYEDIPVVTTTNPPLFDFVKRYCVGECDDNYADAINVVFDNYEQYKRNVLIYTNKHGVSENRNKFVEALLHRIL
jgi:hypothetical protein